MDSENQAPEGVERPNETPDRAEPPRDDTAPDVPPPPPRLPDLRPALIAWLAFIAVAGIAGVAIGAQELALMVALAGLFVAAQAADLDSRWTLFYWLLGAAVPIGGALAFSALTTLANQSALSGAPRIA